MGGTIHETMTTELPVAPVNEVDGSSVAQLLRLEALAVRVITAFSARGVSAVLIKGPVTNRWLYRDALSRPFRDVDVLIPPEYESDAESVLRELGLRNLHVDVLGIHRPNYESTWMSPFGALDLHTRLAGIPVSRGGDAWSRLWEDSVPFSLHGNEIPSLSMAARTMLLGLHAARSADEARPLYDLEVGLESLPASLWREAAELATSLGAPSCFGVGMRRSRRGREFLRGIGFTAAPTLESLLLERAATQETLVVAATVESGQRISARVLRDWFRTERGEPSARARAAALLRLPGAWWTVVMLQRRLRRQTGQS